VGLLETLKAASNRFRPVGEFTRLGADYGYSWWVILLFAFPSYGTNLFYDPQRLGGSMASWIPVALITYAVTVVMFVLFKFIKFYFAKASGIVFIMGSYLIIGWVRGLTAYYVALDQGVGTKEDIYFRLVSPPIFTFVSMTVCAAVVTTVSLQQESLSELAKERTMLKGAISNFRIMQERLQDELLTRVTGIIRPVIDDLRGKLSQAGDPGQTEKALSTLQVTVDEVVRPLSHQIANSDLDPVLDTTGPIKISRTGLLPDRINVSLAPAWGVVLGIGSATTPFAAKFDPFVSAMSVFLVGFSSYVTLKVIEGIIGDRKYRPVTVAVLFLLAYGVSGFVAPLYWTRTPWQFTATMHLNFAGLSIIIGMVMFVVHLANSYRQQSIADLQSVNADMALLTSQLRQQVWLDHRRVAQVLHGSVQGALYAAAIRLGRETVPTPETIESVQKDISDALAEVSRVKSEDFVFEEVLNSIIDLWQDSINFELALDQKAIHKLNANADAAECMLEVLREAVNNSVKHGGARNVSVEIAPKSRGLLSLVVINDGAPLEPQKIKGYGSNVLDELTHEWSIANTHRGVQLSALVVG
jgi:signal transduction histidine kinase